MPSSWRQRPESAVSRPEPAPAPGIRVLPPSALPGGASLRPADVWSPREFDAAPGQASKAVTAHRQPVMVEGATAV